MALKQALDQPKIFTIAIVARNMYLKKYKDFLKENDIESSITKPASPQENTVIERINGILQHEYGLKKIFDNYGEVLLEIKMDIKINNIRPHWSLNLQVPNIAHQKVSTNFRT